MTLVRRAAVFVLLCILCGVDSLRAQDTVSFNFSLSSRPIAGWTNVFGDPSQGIRTATNAATGIKISSVKTANWAQYAGTAAQNDNGTPGGTFFYPGTVMLHRWYQYSSAAQYNALLPQLLISGLNKDSVYTLRMSASSPSTTLNSDPTRYTVTGLTVYGSKDVNIHNNTANGATFYNIAPDDSGRIMVYVNTVASGPNGPTDVADISGLQIIRERTPGPAPVIDIISPFNGSIRPEDGDVVFNVAVAEPGVPIWKVEYYRDSVLLGTSLTAPFSWTWEHVDVGQYTIRARVIDSLGRTATDYVTFTVESLNYFWSTTGNIATNGDTFFVGTVDTNRLSFRTNNQERMTLLGDGTVGIGTKITKGYKLAVKGSAIFEKVRIRNYEFWPDYVFKKDYKLTCLDSLERYIQANQHLPGIISADKAQKEGIDIADNQALLLKKIEELTLYLIEEHRRVEQLTKEVQQLKAKSKVK